MKLALRRLLLAALVSVLVTPAPAHAQITAIPAPGVWGWTHRNTVAFDSVNDVFLVIVQRNPVIGRFVNKAGNQVGADFLIALEVPDPGGNPFEPFTGWASVAFGGPPSDPAFIVTYLIADLAANPKFARLVRFQPGGVAAVSERVHVVDVQNEWNFSEKAQNVWNGQRFIVGTRVIQPGGSLPTAQVNLLDMSLNVSPPVYLGDGGDYYGSPALACASVGVCLAVGFKAGIATGYTGGSYGRLFDGATLTPQGASVLHISPFGQNEDQGVVYLKHTGMFLAEWYRAPGFIDTRLVIPDGTLGPLDQSRAVGPGAGTNAIAYNSKTQTSLLLTKDNNASLWALELGDDGYPIRPANLVLITGWDGSINDYLPSVAANEEDGQWLVAAVLAGGAFGRLVIGTPVDPTTIPLTILTNGALAPATETQPHSQLLLASGGVIPHTWTLVSGTLPPGLGLNGFYLSGTPTTPGTYNFRLRVTSTDAQVAERDFSLTVHAIIIVPPGGQGAHIDGLSQMFISPGRVYRNNLAYDPVNQVYLMIVERPPVVGRFLNKNGAPIGGDFIIASDLDPGTGEPGYLGWVNIAFGGPPSDPVFLVTYVGSYGGNPKNARLVRYVPGGVPTVTAPSKILDVGSEWLYSEKAQSYWTGQHFVVGSRALPPGASLPTPQVNTLDLNGNVSAPVYLGDGGDYYGSPALACSPSAICVIAGFKAGVSTGYTGGTYSRRLNGSTLAPLGPLVTLASGSPNEDQGVVYQSHTGLFLATWFRGGGPGFVDSRLIGPDGSMSLLNLSRGIGPGAGTNAIAYNAGTRTSLLVTKWTDAALSVMELGDDGYPLNLSNVVVVTNWDGSVPDYLPSIAANGADLQWFVTGNLSGGMVARMIQGSQGVASPFNKVGPPTASAQPIGVVASWQVSSGAFGYEYCYDTSNNNTCNTGWRSAGSATTRVFDELIAGQTYYWQVRAVAGAGPVEADGGAWWSFSVEQVGKVAPMPGAVGVPTSATLSWQPSSGSVTYDYCIDAIDNRSCDSAWTSVGTATSAVIFLNAGTTYYWQARVVTAGGPVELNAGAWWRFTTTGAFGKVGPGSDTSGHPIDVLLSWQAAPGATGYEYCLDVTDNGACDSSWVSVGTSTSAQPGGLTAGATYFWQVRALTAGGVVPANSGTWWHFTVANSPVTPPPSPNPVLPADPRSPGQRPQSSWRELPGADLLAPRARGQSILRWPDRLDLAGISSAQLRLESRFAGARSPGMVQVSLNGLTWRTLARVAATSGPSSVVVDLSPYANRAVFLRVVRDNADAAVWSVTNVVFSTTGTAGSVSPRR